jgi:hypothetical protein
VPYRLTARLSVHLITARALMMMLFWFTRHLINQPQHHLPRPRSAMMSSKVVHTFKLMLGYCKNYYFFSLICNDDASAAIFPSIEAGG